VDREYNMVILRGYVRSGEGSTEYDEAMITSAAIIQGSAIAYTSSNGTFYTSADVTLDYVTCESPGHKTVDYSIPAFATRYDPEGVISGSISKAIDTTTIPGHTIITDYSKTFLSGSLVNRFLEMRSGVDDGKTGVIAENTRNSIEVGGTSGGGGGTFVNGGFETGDFTGWVPELYGSEGISTASVTEDSKRSGVYGAETHTEGSFLDSAYALLTQEMSSDFNTIDFWYKVSINNGYGIILVYFTVYDSMDDPVNANPLFEYLGVPGDWINVVINKSDVWLDPDTGNHWHPTTTLKIGCGNRPVS
jgi:hypothetical protein